MAGFVDRQITCAGSAGRQRVQQVQLAGFGIDGEGADIRRVIESRAQRKRVFGRNIEEALVGMDGKERGIDDFRGKFGLAYSARCRLETADVDSLAMTASGGEALLHVGEARIGAEIHEIYTCGHRRTRGIRNGKDS